MKRGFRLLATGSLCCFLLTLPGACSRPVSLPAPHAERVTIYRDAYGVPHVYGQDDASAAFGLAYAQAEDHFEVIEDNYIAAMGRSAEVVGAKGILDDWLNRSLEIVSLSRKELRQLSPEVQALCQAYADGLNYYLETHPEVQPKLIRTFEAWHPLAFIRYLYYQRVLLQYYANLPAESFQQAYQALNPAADARMMGMQVLSKKMQGEGSNAWAVNGSKSASGNPLLLINPHLSFFGNAQVYEAHIMSATGWNFSGYTRFGFPLPYVGFNQKLGWASTDNAADLVDTYRETFVGGSNKLAYRYGGETRVAREWKEIIRVRKGASYVEQELRFRKTHHGPLLGMERGQYLAVRMARYETPGWLEQWYRMTKAENLAAFQKAASRLEVQFGNYLYADAAGNILYVYNGAIPIRSEQFDWSKPVDGSNPDTEWKGYHTLAELPQVLNPASGWIQNCNGTPLLATLGDNPKAENFPSYMIPERDNYRSEHSRRILQETESFTFESFQEKSYSTYLLSAEKELPNLFNAWEQAAPTSRLKTPEMAEAIALLRAWDLVSTTSSVATTLYISWSERKQVLQRQPEGKETLSLRAMHETLQELKSGWGTWQVAWGALNRLQRVPAIAGQPPHFQDGLPSLPVAGAPSWTGAIFTFWTNPAGATKKRYGIGGNSYVSVVEFGSRVKASSLHYFGTSGEPASPHYFDQAARYTMGHYKPAHLTLEDVKAHARQVYKPGEKPRSADVQKP